MPVTIKDVQDAMKEVEAPRHIEKPGPLWYSNPITNGIINAGVEKGWLFRMSTTQVHWTEKGVQFLKNLKLSETIAIVAGKDPAYHPRPFTFRGLKGTIDRCQFVQWAGMGFPLEAGGNMLKAAVHDQTGETPCITYDIEDKIPANYFLCDGCGDLHPIGNMRVESDMDGEEGDQWKLCPACHEERYTATATPKPETKALDPAALVISLELIENYLLDGAICTAADRLRAVIEKLKEQ